jgi:hypothetical protein
LIGKDPGSGGNSRDHDQLKIVTDDTSSTKSGKVFTDRGNGSPRKSQKFNFDYDDEKRKLDDENGKKNTQEKYSSHPNKFSRSKTD